MLIEKKGPAVIGIPDLRLQRRLSYLQAKCEGTWKLRSEIQQDENL